MAKHKKGQPVHGWLIFHKPVGFTSAQAVGYLKRVFNAQKIGHGGTLDPLASGVLPIALGEATKTMGFLLNADKQYTFTVAWGSATNTDDAEGEVVATAQKRPTTEEINTIIPRFVGEITQTPPQFSAIKINGQPAYARARAGEDVAIQPRPVTIFSLLLLHTANNTATFQVHASKGTYVRALARDMGQALGCLGHITMLQRVQAGKFHISQAITKEMLDECLQNGQSPQQFLLDMNTVLDDIPAYVADPVELQALKAGRQLQRIHLKPGVMKVVSSAGRVESLVEIDAGGMVKILRNFAYEPTKVLHKLV